MPRLGVGLAVLLAAGLIAAAGSLAWTQELLGGADPVRTTSIETGITRPGSDILVRKMPSRGVLDCQRLCEITRGCQAFTFELDGGEGVPLCRIKNAKPAPFYSECCVSGVVDDGQTKTASVRPQPLPQSSPPNSPPPQLEATAPPALALAGVIAAPTAPSSTPGAAAVALSEPVFAFARIAAPARLSRLTLPPLAGTRLAAPQLARPVGPFAAPLPDVAMALPPSPPLTPAVPPPAVSLASSARPVASQRPVPPAQTVVPTAPIVVTAPPQARPAPVATVRGWAQANVTVSLGAAGRCWDSPGGLPWPGAPKPLQIWDCHGGGNQRFTFRNGILFAGLDRRAQIVPAIAPTFASCLDWEQISTQRTYKIGLCRASAKEAGPTLELELTSSRGRLRSIHPASGRAVQPGTPLALVAIAGSSPVAPVWEQIVETGQIRLRNTGLCMVLPPDDDTSGAPVYLDACEAPLGLSGRSPRPVTVQDAVKPGLFDPPPSP